MICVLPFNLLAQEEEKNSPIKFSGSVSLSDNFYSANGIDQRQPPNMFMGIARANISLFDQIELPFEVYYTSQQTDFQQPFNQFGISPKLTNWLTLHAGYFSTRFSEFTFGDLRVLGGGIEVTPANFRIKALYGRTMQAMEPNRVSYMPEVYNQDAYAVCVGYGSESKSFVNLNLFHAIDDSASVKSDSTIVAPHENVVGSMEFGLVLSKALRLRGEVGMSAFTNDTRAEEIEDNPVSMPSYLFTPNIASQIDGAAKLQINIKPSRYWSLTLNSRYIGPGFRTLGFALMPNDLAEVNIIPSVRILKNKIRLRAKLGIRYNNLQSQKMATTSRFTGFLAANYQVNNVFGFDINYSKNQIESGHKNDTLRLSNIYGSISASPRFLFNAMGGTNNLIFTYTYQNVADKNVYTSNVSNNNTNSVNVLHSLIYKTSLSFTTSLLYNKSEQGSYTSSIYHLSETVGRSFFENKLYTSATLGANFIEVNTKSSQLVFRFTATYSLEKYGNLAFNISNNSYESSGGVVKDYNELYGSVRYNINF